MQNWDIKFRTLISDKVRGAYDKSLPTWLPNSAFVSTSCLQWIPVIDTLLITSDIIGCYYFVVTLLITSDIIGCCCCCCCCCFCLFVCLFFFRSLTITSPDQVPKSATFPKWAILCRIRQYDFLKLFRIQQP